MNRADEAWRAVLRDTSVADLVDSMARTASPKGLEKGADWLMQVLR